MRYRQLRSGLAFVLLSFLLAPAQPAPAAVPGQVAAWRVIGQIGGPTQAVAVQGNYAYVGVGLRLIVLDVTNPSTPTEVGATAPFPYFVEDVAVSGARAYVAAGGAGLRVVDVSDPANPTELGAWDSPGYAEGVAVAGSTVYLTDGPYGLRTVDVSDPAHPTPLGAAYDMNYAFEVAVSGNHVHIAAAGAGLLVADVSDPAHPVEAGTLDTSGYAYGVASDHEGRPYVYVADGWEGVRIVNVANPITPTVVSTYKTPGWAFDIVVSGTQAYVADAFGGLRVLDISDPAQPAELGGYAATGGHAGSVAVAGNTAYVADRNWGLRVVNVADPSHPTELGLYEPLSYADGVWVDGDYAYVAAGKYGLGIVDISDPAHPIQVSGYDIQTYATSIIVEGRYAYMSTSSPGAPGNGLYVLDVSDPAHPVKVGLFETGLPILDVTVARGIAYLANEWGLDLVSVSDPSHPTELGFIQLWEYVGAPDAAEGVAVSEPLAYVASSWAGLDIVDVSNPVSPTWVGGYDSGESFSQDVALEGNRAYVADYSGLRVLDLSNPLSPIGIGFYDTPGEAYGVVVSGSIAYVACGSGGVTTVDVSDPCSPTLLGDFNTLGYAHQVAVAGNRIYVADGPNGLLILEPAVGHSTGRPGIQPVGPPLPIQAVVSVQIPSGKAVIPPGDLPVTPPQPLRPSTSPTYKPGQATAVAGTCTVTSTADSGAGTLRDCLDNAVGGDTIIFDPAAFPPTTPVTISLSSPLPWLEQGGLTIDASNAGVILDGSGAPPNTAGLVIASDGNAIQGLQILHFPSDGILVFDGAKNNRIGGDRLQGRGPLGQGNLISGNGQNGVDIAGAGTMSNTVTGNFIGTDLSGTTIVGNQVGVAIADGASHNTIGGVGEGQRNVIAGNQNDVVIGGWGSSSEHNVITGNLIGTDPSGSFALRTSPPPGCCTRGVSLGEGARRNVIGPGNVINGSYWGIQLFGEGVDENVIIGNLIGTNVSGTAAIGNFSDGILISEGPQRNRIGGVAPAERNIISGNSGNGISIASAGTVSNTVIGNYVGTDISGTAALGNMGPGGGIQVWSPYNLIERNLVSGNGSNGISLIGSQAHGNRIIGNYTGTDVSGTADLGNRGHGIAMEVGAYNNLVQGNLSSGNSRTGVAISDWGSNYNVVIGNLVGTDASGTQAIPNEQPGVSVGASFNRIGGTGLGEGNLISGNRDFAGVEVYGSGAVGNLILSNYVGTDSSGNQPLPNRSGVIVGGGASHTIIGGGTAAERNIVSGNSFAGIQMASDYNCVLGNYIGTDVSGAAALGNAWVALELKDAEHSVIQGNLIAYNQSNGFWVHAGSFNTIRRNSIHSNGERGIVLTDGGNQMLPAPVILTVTQTTVSGMACPGCTVEVFSDAEDEGCIYEGTAVADAAGVFGFDKGSPLAGPHLTATATDGEGNTSEFSAPAARPVKVYLPLILKSQ